jgi:hypothetical protein
VLPTNHAVVLPSHKTHRDSQPPVALPAARTCRMLPSDHRSIVPDHRGFRVLPGRAKISCSSRDPVGTLRRRPTHPLPPGLDRSGQRLLATYLITEREIREVLEPEMVDQIIDHQRHFLALDGTHVWDQAECRDLIGAIEAGKGVHS